MVISSALLLYIYIYVCVCVCIHRLLHEELNQGFHRLGLRSFPVLLMYITNEDLEYRNGHVRCVVSNPLASTEKIMEHSGSGGMKGYPSKNEKEEKKKKKKGGICFRKTDK